MLHGVDDAEVASHAHALAVRALEPEVYPRRREGLCLVAEVFVQVVLPVVSSPRARPAPLGGREVVARGAAPVGISALCLAQLLVRVRGLRFALVEAGEPGVALVQDVVDVVGRLGASGSEAAE